LDAAILSYLDAHPRAVDSVAGIVAWWLPRMPRDPDTVNQALERLSERKLLGRIRLADGTVLYGKPTLPGPQ
jgi:hypothetical protein